MGDAKKKKAWALGVWSRETVLLTTLAALGIMFAVTEVAVGYYRNTQNQLAQEWFQRGDSALKAQNPREAIEDLRNALSYAPDNSNYQLRLAQALAADNRIEEAESYLLVLWANEPGGGEINLELGELEARKNSSEAARYFLNAIYGVWESDPEQHRTQARMELFRFYRSTGDTGQAQGQLLALAAETSRTDYQRQTRIAQLQLETGDPRQALQQFQSALRVHRNYPPALAGAGAAEFAIGEYKAAIPYLELAVKLNPKDRDAASQLELTHMVLNSDPFEIRLGDRERSERTIDAYLQANSQLANCATRQNVILDEASPQNALQRTWAAGQQLQPLVSHLRGEPQNVLQLMNFVFRTENLAAKGCGPLQGKDQALWLIGKKHQLAEANGQGGS